MIFGKKFEAQRNEYEEERNRLEEVKKNGYHSISFKNDAHLFLILGEKRTREANVE